MELIELKCNACGAPITKKNSTNTVVCEYCGSAYAIKKNKDNSVSLIDTIIDRVESVVQEISPTFDASSVPERPKLNELLFFIGLFVSLPVALVYYLIVSILQYRWDNNYAIITGQIPKRPKINVIICIILGSIYVFPLLIYLLIMVNLQKDWDKKYKNYIK